MPLFFFVFFARPLMSFFCLLQLRVVNSSRSHAVELKLPYTTDNTPEVYIDIATQVLYFFLDYDDQSRPYFDRLP